MKKRFFIVIVIMLIMSVILIGCSANYKHPNSDMMMDAENTENGDFGSSVEKEYSSEYEHTPELPNRMIIYSVNTNLYTDNLNDTIKKVKDALKADEWLDKESISSYNADLTIRVRSNRLDAFINDLYKAGTVTNFTKSAKDISLIYQDTAGRKNALISEQERLIELISTATTSDMITINKRLAEIDYQLAILNGELNMYDSLHEYSTVSLMIIEAQAPKEVKFGSRINSAFKGGWKSLKIFFEWLVIAFVAVFPFAITFVPLAILIIVLIKVLRKRKRKNKINNLDTDNINDK